MIKLYKYTMFIIQMNSYTILKSKKEYEIKTKLTLKILENQNGNKLMEI